MVADVGMTFPAFLQVSVLVFLETFDAQGDAMVHPHVVANHGRFADDDALTVVDAEGFADLGAWMDVDRRRFPTQFTDDPG